MQQMSSGSQAQVHMKAQVVDKIPKRFKELKFGIQSTQDIVNQAVLEVSDRILFDVEKRRSPIRNGVLDPRLGICSKKGLCETCGDDLHRCNGHFGHLRLALPAFHIGYLKLVTSILQEICKDCARVLLTEAERRSFLRELRRPNIDNLKRTQICKRINEQCRKAKHCPHCGAINGQIRKINVFKITHDRFQAFNKANQSNKVKKAPPPSKVAFDSSFHEAKETNKELEKHLHKAMEDLNPLRVLNLFKLITQTDCELLGINPAEGRPEMFIWQYIPVPPICIRPGVAQDSASTEDDLTTKLSEIIYISQLITAALDKGQPVSTIMEQWEYLQLQIGMYVNSDVPGLQQPGFGKTIRGFCQRLKGKQGRFRGNLSGKRVDFSGRTVISPDPNLGIDEVAVPILVAKNLTYPEQVYSGNIEKLRERVRNGADKFPGANTLIKQGAEHKISLKYGNLQDRANQLRIGDIVERHLEDGDIVLFNRQPSLHKLSIMSHYVKVRPWRTFRLNECVCTPYNADFDGDEMNLHVPQTEEARTEAINLMGVKNNLCTPKNGEPIISATQDFITAAYLLSSKDEFFDRKTFTTLCMYMVDGKVHLDIPRPAILKPQELWTGKQVLNVLIRINKKSMVKVNMDAKCRDYKSVAGQTPDMDPNDGWLVIRNSEIMCGRMDKTTVGSGKKDCIFYVILRDFGPDEAAQAMNRLAKLSARYLTNQGFSIGISDVIPGADLVAYKHDLLKRANHECQALIIQFKNGTLKKATGCNLEETLENKISGLLSRVRQTAGAFCIDTLSKWNSPLIMAKSGSKGSEINVAQMVTLVGQQMISGARVADGFQDRTLPHFPKNARQPASKGFVRSSFFDGLTPTEFLFHAISGREGLVDTAVKTAETGYMSRRLMKSLEDLSSQYDNTVRNSSGGVVQFQFGADKLDPVDMEGTAVPVNFHRTFTHASSITWNNNDRALLPYEIYAICEQELAAKKKSLTRHGLLHDEILNYNDQSDYAIDEHESARAFLDTISRYIFDLAAKLAKARQRSGLYEFKDSPKLSGRHYDDELEEIEKRVQMEQVAKVSEPALKMFIKLCLTKYMRAHVEPGHAVGAVGAQSIGEPGTQMTLRTFHFAGVAGMSITQGVPRIKEIINASKIISTPVITCPLENPQDLMAARVVKSRIEKTYMRDVINFIEDQWQQNRVDLCIQVDTKALADMHLDLSVANIAEIILSNKKLKLKIADVHCDSYYIYIEVHDEGSSGKTGPRSYKENQESTLPTLLGRVNQIKRIIPQLSISGYPDAARAIIETSETSENMVLVEGYGLRACMTTEGVVGTKCTTNSVMECYNVLGIEAARSTIATEIETVMMAMSIDPRHMQLLADVMTYKGEVLGITRFGLSKMRDSVLQLASFEKTPDHLFDAAAGMKRDAIEGVSECIIMGQTMSIGTGAFRVVRDLEMKEGDICEMESSFEDLWAWDQAERRKETKAKSKIAKETNGDAMELGG